MARYKVGNKFLSQEEYDSEMDWRWVCGLFLFGSILTGFLLKTYVVNPDWYKAIRFFVVVIPSVAVGLLLVKLRNLISLLIGLLVLLIVAVLIIGIISSLI